MLGTIIKYALKGQYGLRVKVIVKSNVGSLFMSPEFATGGVFWNSESKNIPIFSNLITANPYIRQCKPGCVCKNPAHWLHADGTCTVDCQSIQVPGGPVFTTGNEVPTLARQLQASVKGVTLFIHLQKSDLLSINP